MTAENRGLLALTIHQPWAWFIAHGYKPIENRSWAPPKHAVGAALAIHASKNMDEARGDLGWAWSNRLLPDSLGLDRAVNFERLLAEMAAQRGHILAVSTVAGVVRASDSRWFFGPVGWQLSDTVKIEPVACRGAQGLWRVPPEVLPTVREKYLAARCICGSSDPGDQPREDCLVHGLPVATCPACGRMESDRDGFGILAHRQPAYPNGCGYCSHPSRDNGRCGICGDVEVRP